MRPERWQQLDQLFHSALERQPSERAAFLDEACRGDDLLHKEVESLLAGYEESASFIEKPALEVEARAVAEDQNQLSAGQTIGHYRILSVLGVGGMGEVYLAEDITLGRKVALKLLPADFTRDIDRVRRFAQEARAASALNHPNIVTTYEIGHDGSFHFIAEEFIDGVTLREQLNGRRLELNEALDIATQVASALAAAHAKGIVHRDIKPENIMVDPGGHILGRQNHVKVLDFGIAKLTEPSGYVVKPEATTRLLLRTEEGSAIGTAPYMSPEQTRGESVDARTDIWSFGVVLYEMLTGEQPFGGVTAQDVSASVLKDDLPPLPSEFPESLKWIVKKSLRKDQEARYQTARDLFSDLHDLQGQAEGEGSKHSAPSRADANAGAGRTSDFTIKHHKRSVIISLGLLAMAVVVAAYFFYFAPAAKAIDSIAVLPLANVSGNADTEYLSDGITESVISNLSKLPQLRVMARATVFRFKGKEIDPKVVGKQLGVRAVLMGRLMRQGEQVIVRTELVNVADGTQLWGAEYDRKLSDVLGLQQEISCDISEKLQLRLTGDQQKRLAAGDTRNAEAYQLYLLGRFHWNKFTVEGARKSIDYFNQALAQDPSYALAYFGLSDAYQILGQIGVRPNEVCPQALVYAEKALSADPTLPEAHFTRGAYELWYGWNWTIAEQELKRAFEPNTNVAGAHDLYGQFLSGMGRFDEAIAENKRALELDPLSPISISNLGVVYYYARRYDLAIEQNRKAMELDANFFFAPLYIGWAYGQQGKYPEATAQLIKTRDLPGGFAPATAELGYIYAVSGERTEAQKMLRELEKRAKLEFVDPYYMAIINIGLDDRDETFGWFNKAFDERSFWLLWLRVEPKFERLHSDPRYQDLLRRMNFPPQPV